MSEHHFGTDDLFDITAGLDKTAGEADAVAEQMHEAFDRTGTQSTFSEFLAPTAASEEAEAEPEAKEAGDPDEDYWEVHGGSLTATEKRILNS